MYAAAAEYWGSRRERHAATIEAIAVVVPAGFIGAVIIGLIAVVDVGCNVRAFRELEAALQWLGEEDSSVLATELRRVRPVRADDGLLQRLARVQAELGIHVEVAQAARRLGMSERTLQRKLSYLGTTFQTEVLRVKLAEAARLILTRERNMTAIAFDLGFASLQHFSARFSAVYGDPPSSWLRKHSQALAGVELGGNQRQGNSI